MKKSVYFIILIIVLCTSISCEKNDETPEITKIDYIGFEPGFRIKASPLESKTQEIIVATSIKTTGNRTYFLEVNTDLTTLDASSYSIPASVTVLANKNIGLFDIEVIGTNVIPFKKNYLAIGFVSPRDNSFVSEPILLTIKPLCANHELVINLSFDNYPEELYWRILDTNNNILFESLTSNGTDPEYGAYTNESGFSDLSGCLDSGTYTFEMYDASEDGAGAFNLVLDGDEIFSSDGAYDKLATKTFTIP